MFYEDYTYYRYICNIYVWRSDPFLELLPRPTFSPLLSTPFLARCGRTLCLWSKEGERKTYFKTGIFYAFVIKANLFSKCAMSEWNWRAIWGWGGCPEVRPSSLPPSPAASLLPLHSLQRIGPRVHTEHLARAGRPLGNPGLRVWLHCHCQFSMTL